jgi:hypothetical protein
MACRLALYQSVVNHQFKLDKTGEGGKGMGPAHLDMVELSFHLYILIPPLLDCHDDYLYKFLIQSYLGCPTFCCLLKGVLQPLDDRIRGVELRRARGRVVWGGERDMCAGIR